MASLNVTSFPSYTSLSTTITSGTSAGVYTVDVATLYSSGSVPLEILESGISVSVSATNETINIIPTNTSAVATTGITASTSSSNIEVTVNEPTIDIEGFSAVPVVPVSIINISQTNTEILDHPVDNDRLINLRNFLPTSFDGTEVSDFIGFFEHTKNGASTTTDVSILKKIELLFTLRDPDLIDEKFIQYFASQMGYNINYSKLDITNVTGDTSDNDINGYLRNTIRSLPHWYKFKSTNNALIMLMYSFGIVSDILTMWTTDYDTDWVSESPRFEQDATPPGGISDGYYPTPHYKIVVNDSRTPSGWQTNLDNIITLVESIKPINTVFEGFAVKVFIDGINPGFDVVGVKTTPVINSIKIGTSTMLNTQTP
jgi:hypothetical protein